MSLDHEWKSLRQPERLSDNRRLSAEAVSTTSPALESTDAVDWLDFQADVKESLRRHMTVQKTRAATFSPSFAELWDRIAESVEGGKLMRPKLLHLSYVAFGGTDWQACSDLAAAYEMLHAALVVHDDVIDRDFIRRGVPTLGAAYRDAAAREGHEDLVAEHAGYSAAIIAGDLLLTGSLLLAGTAVSGHAEAGPILGTLHEAIFASAAGELDDLLYSLDLVSPGLGEVLNMERLKTAVYSFEMPLRAGALLAGAGAGTADALAAVGRDIGVAYQVIDDVLGTFGDQSVTGKSVESDLREGKRTILTSYAHGSEEFASALLDFHQGRLEIQDVREVLRETGAQEYALNLARTLVDDALEKAQDLGMPDFLHLELSQICDHVLARRN